jgi:hypothetical protein
VRLWAKCEFINKVYIKLPAIISCKHSFSCFAVVVCLDKRTNRSDWVNTNMVSPRYRRQNKLTAGCVRYPGSFPDRHKGPLSSQNILTSPEAHSDSYLLDTWASSRGMNPPTLVSKLKMSGALPLFTTGTYDVHRCKFIFLLSLHFVLIYVLCSLYWFTDLRALQFVLIYGFTCFTVCTDLRIYVLYSLYWFTDLRAGSSLFYKLHILTSCQ